MQMKKSIMIFAYLVMVIVRTIIASITLTSIYGLNDIVPHIYFITKVTEFQ